MKGAILLDVLPADALVDELAREVERVADRLRALSLVRLGAGSGEEGSPAGRARGLAQLLADTCADIEGGPRRPLPALADAAVGDQVAVTGADLVAVATSEPGARAALEQALDAVRALRRAL